MLYSILFPNPAELLNDTPTTKAPYELQVVDGNYTVCHHTPFLFLKRHIPYHSL